LEVKDLLLHLETAYNIRVPGFGDGEVKPVRKASTSAAHQQRLSQVRRAQAADAAEKEREKTRMRERAGGAFCRLLVGVLIFRRQVDCKVAPFANTLYGSYFMAH
jgi:hypothetical protein